MFSKYHRQYNSVKKSYKLFFNSFNVKHKYIAINIHIFMILLFTIKMLLKIYFIIMYVTKQNRIGLKIKLKKLRE